MTETGASPAPPETGDARVDEALRGVEDLDALPVDQHADQLGAAHAALQDVLHEPDPGGPTTKP